MSPVQSQLAGVVNDLQFAQQRLKRLDSALAEARWNSRPAADRWSPAECVEHLNMTSRAYLPLLRRALEESARASRDAGRHYRRDFLGWLFSLIVGPLPRLGRKRLGRVRTSADFLPAKTLDHRAIVREFDQLHAQLVAVVRDADGLPLEEMMIASPFGGRIRYNFYSALRILPRHQHRHLQQAEDAGTG